MRKLILLLAVTIFIIACNGLVNPPTGPNTEYPCGIWGVECSIKSTGSMCCPQNHICGFNGEFSRCPEGMCCYDGDHWPNLVTESDGGKELSLIPQYKILNRGIGR